MNALPLPMIELELAEHVMAAHARTMRAALAKRRDIALTDQGRGVALNADVVIIYATELNRDVHTLVRARMCERDCQRRCPIVVALCGSAACDQTRELLNGGVWNVIADVDQSNLIDSIAACAVRLQSVESVLHSKLVRDHLVGNSMPWLAFLRELIWVAKYSNAAVLLNGETGTGKELMARLIHTLDERENKGEMIIVDCTTLGHDLAGSELFGHERGAFTGAHAQRVGAAALANGGTLFLDEVGELQLTVQAQLLRLLQEGTYKPVGSGFWRTSSFRLICATHRNLREAVCAGRFREDLYFRLNGWTVDVPPLRERKDDIRALADVFLNQFGCPEGINESVADALSSHPFPGNVRELRQLMMQSAVKHCGRYALSLGDLPMAWRRAQNELSSSSDSCTEVSSTQSAISPDAAIEKWVRSGLQLREITQRAGDIAIREALALERNHLGRAARRLGVTERAIQLRKAQRSLTASSGPEAN
jgi:transcriptional regulator with GAF, ATPase, and Fis domain